MNTITGLLEGFEKIAYKFLLAILFFPKTIFQIIVNPGWAPDYIKGEFRQEQEKKGSFDKYVSPVILLLVVALIPALVINFLPTFGIVISSTAEKEPTTLGEVLVFNAETNTRSGSAHIYNKYSWYVEKIKPGELDENGYPKYSEIYRETYNENTDKTEIILNNEKAEFDGQMYTFLEYPNQNYNTSKNAFYYAFPESGEYYVNVEVINFDPARPDEPVLEHYYSYRYVNVPSSDDNNQQITVLGGSDSRASNRKASGGNISDLLKKETTIFLALGLLFPPLLFALATKLFRGEEISENMLRESFYAQCYYFSPISLAIWATYYARYFVTPDVFFYKSQITTLQLILLPSILAVLWFIGTETQAVARERQTQGWKAFLIVIVCTAILGAAGYLVSLFVQPYSQIQNNLRKFTIFAYPLISAALVLVVGIAWFRRRKIENQRITIRDVAFIVAPLLIAVFATGLISFIMSFQPDAPAETTQSADSAQLVSLDVQETPAALQQEIDLQTGPTESSALEVVSAITEQTTEATPTDTPLPEAQPFYAEEFDNPLSSDWSVFTVEDSDQANANKVIVGVQDGKLVWNFDSVYVYYYLFNEAFRYEDVRLDVRADNRGRNNNNISLICRYDPNVGWYEFNIANNGLYDIYFAEMASNGKVVYNSITNGGSNAIKIGREVNEYSIVCKGQQLTLFINGEEVNSVVEKYYSLREGQVGVSVSSFDVLPILIEMDWVKISEP